MGNRWKPQTMLERFEEKFDKTDGCWEWKAGSHERGYGHFYTGRQITGRKMEFAHRISYELYKGDPTGYEVRHSCDNPKCVNPEHLKLGTHQDNMDDMAIRKRARNRYTGKLANATRTK